MGAADEPRLEGRLAADLSVGGTIIDESGTSRPTHTFFGRGDLGKDGIALSETGQTGFVLAGGLGYVVNTIDRRLLHRSAEVQLQTVVSVPHLELFIAADFIRLHAYGRSGLEWSSGRISLDGIRLGTGDASGLDGLRYTCEWLCPY